MSAEAVPRATAAENDMVKGEAVRMKLAVGQKTPFDALSVRRDWRTARSVEVTRTMRAPAALKGSPVSTAKAPEKMTW